MKINQGEQAIFGETWHFAGNRRDASVMRAIAVINRQKTENRNSQKTGKQQHCGKQLHTKPL